MMGTSTVLGLCARPTSHGEQYRLLRQACSRIDDWQALLVRADQEGMTPLLALHLEAAGIAVSPGVRRSLRLLLRRHGQYAQLLTETLTRALALLQGEGLSPLLLKGAALRHTLYADPAMRPMRDIDLLLDRSEVDRAQALLRQAGFAQSTAPIPTDHFHLPALMRWEGPYTLCLELHWGLYPNCPPWYEPVDVAALWRRGRDCAVAGVLGRSLGDEDMLLHLYLHGIRAPLTFEPARLINLADIVGLVEARAASLDWEQLERRCPQLVRALPLLHHVTPWRPGAVPAVIGDDQERGRRRTVALFTGWPHRKIRAQRLEGRSLPALLRATFVPPGWWLGVYYGADSLWRRLGCMLWEHPRHVWWWIRLYAAFLDQEPGQERPAAVGSRISGGWARGQALWRKLIRWEG